MSRKARFLPRTQWDSENVGPVWLSWSRCQDSEEYQTNFDRADLNKLEINSIQLFLIYHGRLSECLSVQESAESKQQTD